MTEPGASVERARSDKDNGGPVLPAAVRGTGYPPDMRAHGLETATDRSPMHTRARLALAVLFAALACEKPPVEWTSRHVVAISSVPATIDADGRVRTDSLLLLAARLHPPTPACVGSLGLSRSAGTLHAAWWSVRPDSGARLLAAHSEDDGAHWSAAVAVDTTDRGVSGCHREPPSIAADPRSGYVHVSYGLVAPEGPGVFFAHSMDGGDTFHSPVAIVYGEHPGRTSVAADGDVVAVAFEQPDESVPRVGLALSRTMGHIFEQRLLPVSDGNGMANRPLVSVHGRRIAVGWEQRAADTARTVLVVRAGTLR